MPKFRMNHSLQDLNKNLFCNEKEERLIILMRQNTKLLENQNNGMLVSLPVRKVWVSIFEPVKSVTVSTKASTRCDDFSEFS